MAKLSAIIGAKDKSSNIFSRFQRNIDKTIKSGDNLNKKLDNLGGNGLSNSVSSMDNFGKSIQNAGNATDPLNNFFDSLPGKIITINQAISLLSKGMELLSGGAESVDTFITTRARLDLMNDGLQTTEELTNKLYASANRSRAGFDDLSAQVSKLGVTASEAFTSNDQIIKFTETANKMAILSGSSSREASNAMYQLTQALASGRLQGDELRSVMEQMPMYMNALEDSLGVNRAELRAMAKEGELTSDILVKAMMEASSTVDEQFATFPQTFASLGNTIKNEFSRTMMTVKTIIADALNSKGFQTFINFIINAMMILLSAIVPIVQVIIGLFTLIGEAIAFIGELVANNTPLILGLLGAVVVMIASQLIPNILFLIQYYGILMLQSIKMGLTMFKSWIQGMSPVTIVIAAIVAIVGALVWLTGSFEAAGNIIGGIIASLGAFIYNGFVVSLWNGFALLGNFLANVFLDPVYAVKRLMADLLIWMIDKIRILTDISDAIGFSDFGSEFDDIEADLNAWVGDAPSNANPIEMLEEIDYNKAWNAGSAVGGMIGGTIDDFFGGFGDLFGGLGNPLEDYDLNGIGDYANPSGGVGGSGIPIGSDGKVPVNASGSDVNISDEDLKYLKDIASREFMLNYKKVEPNFQINMTGDINQNADSQAMLDGIKTLIEEEYASMYLEELG